MAFRYFPRLLGAFSMSLLTLSSYAQSQSHQDFSCASSSSKRTVTIITFAPSELQPRGGCRVDYTKDGVTKGMWSSATGHAYCTKQATKLVTKLTEAHYECRLQTPQQPAD
jgi:hypothetical protein